jgi:endonuclease/exonuclease/phosphatase (EEP) superfamily protein YafD
MVPRLVRPLLVAIAWLVSTALVLHASSILGVFPRGSMLSGASYLPASWWIPLILPLAAGNWLVRRRRSALVLIGGFAAVFALSGDVSLRPRPRPPVDARRTLSVVALNVRYYLQGRGEVVHALQQIGADVALLSENVLGPAESAQIRQELLPADFRMGRSGETAIISRLPILSFDEVDLPSRQASLSGPDGPADRDSRPHRSFVHAVIDVHGVPVHVVSIRLIAGRAPANDPWTQLQWAGYLLRTQAEELASFEDYLRRLKGPIVFGGDLNATPPSFVVRRLSHLAIDSFLALHLVGWPTFRVAAPLTRIDYLFASPELTPVRADRIDVEVSDHFPVYAEYQLAGGAPSVSGAGLSNP